MKLLRVLFSLVVLATLVFGSVYIYRSCSLRGCMDDFSILQVYAEDGDAAVWWSSSVLNDLRKDDSFDEADYPEREKDYSIQVIQVAEASNGDLFVYTYQPSGKTKPLKAISIRMSTTVNEDVSWKDYSLAPLSISESGTLIKYNVMSFKVKTDPLRYYDIAAIHRPFDWDIDEQPGDDNTVSSVVYEVAQRWIAYNVGNAVMYSMQKTEVITVTDKHVGFIRYDNGFTLYDKACDSHYVAFSTDRNMEKLMEADLTYYSRKGSCDVVLGDTTNYKYEIEQKNFVSLDYHQEASNPAHGWFADKYTWNRIETVSDFVKKEPLTDDTRAALKGKEWVLRFTETSYNRSAVVSGTGVTVGRYKDTFTDVTQVTILRLKFETDGNVYNLGVVDNVQSGDTNPDGSTPGLLDKIRQFLRDMLDWFIDHWEIVLAVGLVIVTVLVALEILNIIWRK